MRFRAQGLGFRAGSLTGSLTLAEVQDFLNPPILDRKLSILQNPKPQTENLGIQIARSIYFSYTSRPTVGMSYTVINSSPTYLDHTP